MAITLSRKTPLPATAGIQLDAMLPAESVTRSTALESVAAHGSISYGFLPAERLKAIMLGETPSDAESARVHQALTETPGYRLCSMARELGMDLDGLQRRYAQLTGLAIPGWS